MLADKKIKTSRSNWKFDSSVAKNFNSHVKKSVPYYDHAHEIILGLSDFFLKNNSLCYDLGCSNGSLIKKIAKRHPKKKFLLEGYDTSKDMIKEAKKNLKDKRIKFFLKDVSKLKLKKNDLILSLFTMQFIAPNKRQKIFDNIYKSLNWGGALVLCEKIRGNDARFQDILNFLYFDFKSKSFSSKEILNKESSLRGIMEPFTIQSNIDYLKRAGFKDIMPIYQYLCFKGFLAIK
tara:strand:- start:16 stop:717 length:702 start_codon:yes stop_codon:yes gene_type:complete